MTPTGPASPAKFRRARGCNRAGPRRCGRDGGNSRFPKGRRVVESSEHRVERLDPDPPLADWLVALSRDSTFERPQAAPTWGRAAPPLAAVQSLLSLLKDPNRTVRRQAVTALGNLPAAVRRVLPPLHAALKEAALNEGDDGVRTEAVRALLKAGPQPASEAGALVDALHSDLEVVRFH